MIHLYDELNTNIKHLTNANEFISRLLLTPDYNVSSSVLNQLKETLGFSTILLPQLTHFGLDWTSSTQDVPDDMFDFIHGLDVSKLFDVPYDPILVRRDGSDFSSQFDLLFDSFDAEECYLLPIVQNYLLVGYMIGFCSLKNHGIDMNLLSIINKQISSILCRSIVNTKIINTKQFYQEIIDYLSSIIVVVNSDFDIQFSNHYFKTFFTKDYSSFYELIYDYPTLEVIHKIKDFSDTELTIKLKSYHFKVSLRYLMDDNIIVLLTNVTELVHIQESISKSSKLKGIGTFVAGVAHEIKNPLVAVKTFTQLISKDWATVIFEDKCRDIVLPQLRRIDNLSQSLNYADRTEASSFEPIDLSQLLHDTHELLLIDSRFAGLVKLSFSIEPNIMVFANQMALGQVFLNLALNAMDAVHFNDCPQISFRLFTDATTKVIIDVEDNGTGVSLNDRQHLFDPFFTTKDDGTGLGLSIVHQIVLDHQGVISVHKSDDKGTVFRLVFPKLLRPKNARSSG